MAFLNRLLRSTNLKVASAVIPVIPKVRVREPPFLFATSLTAVGLVAHYNMKTTALTKCAGDDPAPQSQSVPSESAAPLSGHLL